MGTSTLVAVFEPFWKQTRSSKFLPHVLQLMVQKLAQQLFPKPFSLKIAMPDISQSQQIWVKTHLTHFLIRQEKSVVPFCKQPYCKPVCQIWAENVFLECARGQGNLNFWTFNRHFLKEGMYYQIFFAVKCFFLMTFHQNKRWNGKKVLTMIFQRGESHR